MPNIFTIFNHGTAFHRDSDPKELVTMVSRAVNGYEARIVQKQKTQTNPLGYGVDETHGTTPNFLICEGPGSGTVTATKSSWHVAHSQPGQLNPIFEAKKNQGASHSLDPTLKPKGIKKKDWYWNEYETTSDFQDSFMGNTKDNPGMTGGLLSGEGWDDNVYKAVFMLSHLIMERQQQIDVVNMVGWSRGAVTCLKMAYKLYQVFPQLEVNICAVDPVPGGTSITKKENFMDIVDQEKREIEKEKIQGIYKVLPNVRNYLIFLAMHDYRNMFRPTDRDVLEVVPPTLGQGVPKPPTNIVFLPFPGDHSALVQPQSEPMKSYDICLFLASRFLKKFGTPFKTTEYNNILLKREACLKYYRQMACHLDQVYERCRAAAKSWCSGTGLSTTTAGPRDVWKDRLGYAPLGYLNLHHYQCEKELNPATAGPANVHWKGNDHDTMMWTAWNIMDILK